MLTNKLYETANHYIGLIRARRPSFAMDRGNRLCIMITDSGMITGVSGIRITDGQFELVAAEWNAVLALLESEDTAVRQMVIVSFDDLRIKMPCRDCVEQLLDLNEDNAACEILTDPDNAVALGRYAENMPADEPAEVYQPYPQNPYQQPYPQQPYPQNPYQPNPYQQPYPQNPYPAQQPGYPQPAQPYVDYNSAAPYVQKPYVVSSQYTGSAQAMGAKDSVLKKKLAMLFDDDEIEEETPKKAQAAPADQGDPAAQQMAQPMSQPMSQKELKKMAKEHKKLLKQQRSKR